MDTRDTSYRLFRNRFGCMKGDMLSPSYSVDFPSCLGKCSTTLVFNRNENSPPMISIPIFETSIFRRKSRLQRNAFLFSFTQNEFTDLSIDPRLMLVTSPSATVARTGILFFIERSDLHRCLVQDLEQGNRPGPSCLSLHLL